MANGFAQDSPKSIKVDGPVNDIKYSPDGTLIAVATSQGLWLYDARTLKRIKTFAYHIGGVNALAFSLNGKSLVSVGLDNTIQVWHVDNGELRKRNAFSINSILAITFDGSEILRGATAAGDIPEWNASTGKVISSNNRIGVLNRSYNINGTIKMDSRTAAAFSADGQILARAGKFGEIGKGLIGIEDVYIRTLPTDIFVLMQNIRKNILHFSMKPKDPAKPNYPITALAFSPQKNHLIAIGSESGKIGFLDIEAKKVLGPRLEHKGVNALAFAKDGTLASGSKDSTVLIWKNPTSK